MKQCAFQWLISNDIAHKEMFFNGLIYPSFDYEYRHQLWNYIYYIVMQLPFILQFMMTSSNGNIFRVTVTFCAGNSPVTDEFPAQRPVTALMFSLICAWTNDWANNREAGDLRRYRDYYDIIVMWKVSVNSHHTMLIWQQGKALDSWTKIREWGGKVALHSYTHALMMRR